MPEGEAQNAVGEGQAQEERLNDNCEVRGSLFVLRFVGMVVLQAFNSGYKPSI